MRKLLAVAVALLIGVLVVYLVVDYSAEDIVFYSDSVQHNYSREDFYTEYLDLVINNENKSDNDDTSANGSTNAIMAGSVIESSPIIVNGEQSGMIQAVDEISDPDIAADIAAGLYSAEDYNYLVALGGESSTYQGFYAVACCVRNRVNRNGSSYKAEVTKAGQFAGYHTDEVGKPRNENVKKAAVAVLRGGESTVGDCYFFFGRVNGYDIWAEPGIDCFYNVGNNVYYNKSGAVHNKKSKQTTGAIIIYNHITGEWKYPSGTCYHK